MNPSARPVAVSALSVFQMPAAQTMVSRKSSITNAFVNAVIPSIYPTESEVAEALGLLEMATTDVRCAYCGDRSTEWDHLRPLVLNQRPTGYISEIANLVPACGKCNQSKGNKPWRDWMLSSARLSPTARRVEGTADRIRRLEAFAQWRPPTQVDFLRVLEPHEWDEYWARCDAVNTDLRRAQEVADQLRERVRREILDRD